MVFAFQTSVESLPLQTSFKEVTGGEGSEVRHGVCGGPSALKLREAGELKCANARPYHRHHPLVRPLLRLATSLAGYACDAAAASHAHAAR